VSPPRAALEQALRAAGRRLALLSGLRRAGWVLLAAVVALEVGFALQPWLPTLAAAAWAASGLLAAGGAAAVVARRPGAGVVAGVLDARLGRGACVATGAEALGGAHALFADLVVAEAAGALEGASLRRLLPFRLPVGLVLGAAAAALLPALILARPVGAAGAAGLEEPPTLLSPDVLAGGGGDAPEEEPADAPDGPGALTLLDEGPGADEAAADPLAAFSPELAEVLRRRLAELAREAGATGATGGPGAADPAAPARDGPGGARAVDERLRGGDAEGALEAMAELAEAAGRGDRAAAAELAALSERLGPPGGGRGPAPDPAAPDHAPDAAPADDLAEGGRRGRLPWALAVARDRYFAANTKEQE